MRDPVVLVARRGRGWRDAQRAMQRAFAATSEPPVQSRRLYLDTFDFRMLEGGLELFAVADRLVLRDATSGEMVASSPWRAGPARDDVRIFARDLDPGELRDRVAPLSEPRALLAVARARVLQHELVARDGDGQLVARVRSEAVALRRNGRACAVRMVHVDTPADRPDGDAKTTERLLAASGFRATHLSAYDLVLVAAGRRPRRAARAVLNSSSSIRAAATLIFERELAVMEENEFGIIEDIDPEFLHDYRVALRRTRTALRLFKGAFTAEEFRGFRARFAALSGPTGRLRDLDVHLGAHDEYVQWVPSGLRESLVPTFDSLARQREERYRALSVILSSRGYETLKRDWRRALARLKRGHPAGLLADEPALPVARESIESRYQRLCAIADNASALDETALHRARVQSKRLRYVLEFFAVPLGQAARTAAKGVERLQDALGDYHDAGVLEPLVHAELNGVSPDAPAAVQRAAALGAWMARIEIHREKARRRSVRRIERLTGKKMQGAIRRVLESE